MAGWCVPPGGGVRAIVEAKDYDPALYGPEPHEVNAGMYCVRLDLAARLLPRIGNANKSGEYYITDLISLAVAEGCKVQGVQCGRDESLMGVNSPLELSRSEECLRGRVVDGLLRSGVMLHAPALVRISPLATVEPGAEITGPCEIYGRSVVRRGARIDSHCVLRDTVIEAGAEIRSFCHFEDAHVGEAALVGPMPACGPAPYWKRPRMWATSWSSKIPPGQGRQGQPPLTYLGDSEIGAGTNIGAGTITCNYDGKHKFKTTIGEGAFIGSNTALVAPVRVGDGAPIGAGSVITKDVPDGEMGIARGRQKNLPRKAVLDRPARAGKAPAAPARCGRAGCRAAASGIWLAARAAPAPGKAPRTKKIALGEARCLPLCVGYAGKVFSFSREGNFVEWQRKTADYPCMES